MATRVQTTALNQQITVNSIAQSFSSLPAAGNFIVVCVAAHAGANSIRAGQVTDNQGNTYSLAVVADPSGISPSCAIFYAAAIGAPSGTFTVTYTPLSNANVWIVLEEWSGMGNAPTVLATHSSNGGSTTPNTGSTASVNAGAGALAVAVSAIPAANTSYVVDSVSPAWVQMGEKLGTPGGLDPVAPPGEADSRVVTGTGTQSCGWTSDVSGGWSAGIVVFAPGYVAIEGWFAAGLNWVIKKTRAAMFSLDGNTNVMDQASDIGKLKVFGNFEVTGTTTFKGPLTASGDLAGLLDRVVTAGGDVVVDSSGNIVYTT